MSTGRDISLLVLSSLNPMASEKHFLSLQLPSQSEILRLIEQTEMKIQEDGAANQTHLIFFFPRGNGGEGNCMELWKSVWWHATAWYFP